MKIERKGRLFLLIACAVVIVASLLASIYFSGKIVFHIAVAGHLKTDCKELREVMERLRTKRIELSLVEFSADQAKNAPEKIARRIVADKRTLLVIDADNDAASPAARRIYAKRMTPVIGALPVNDFVTTRNDRYFRMGPHPPALAEFSARVIERLVGKNGAFVIIFDRDEYGALLARSVESEALKRGVNLVKKWGFDKKSGHFESEFYRIILQLMAMSEPRIIVFFATHAPEAAKILVWLKYPDVNYTFIGADALIGAPFTERHRALSKQYGNEEKLDGVHVIYSRLDDGRRRDATRVAARVVEEAVGPLAAHMEDALERVETGVDPGLSGAAGRRKEIWRRLRSIDGPGAAVQGENGPIWFDMDGYNVRAELNVGVYEGGEIKPVESLEDLPGD
ncbi:MAG: hypothetical protein GY859_17510 [Desulfobacterales bacterium]|nr:hypothetical protein [Desulfobacterales bacterium]